MTTSPEATRSRPTEVRTLFFNLSHEDFASREYFFIGGGGNHRLTRVSDAPHVLAKARTANAFLRAVPDDQITHHLEDAAFATDTVTLAYLGSDIDKSAGTWLMSSTHFVIPSKASAHAFALANSGADGHLPLSNKRRKYKLPPSATLQELAEESVLLDSTDFAATLVCSHPDLLSREPDSAAHIYHNHVGTSGDIQFLSAVIEQAGPALPQQQPGQPNPSGWATQIPLTDDKGSPIKNPKSGRIQYIPDWSSRVDLLHAKAVGNINPAVKNDTSLGADVTGLAPGPGLEGKIWARHDGTPTVIHGAQRALTTGGLKFQYQQQNGEAGLKVSNPAVSEQADGSVQITLDNVSNWFLRFLGMWLQFIDANGNTIPVKELPDGIISGRGRDPYLPLKDKDDALIAALVPPAWAIAGIPVMSGSVSVVVNLPKGSNIAALKVYYAGLGWSGTAPDTAPEGITTVGVAMTYTVNFGMVALFMAAGVSTMSPVIKFVVSSGGQAAVGEIVGVLFSSSPANDFLAAVMGFLKGLISGSAVPALGRLAGVITTAMGEAEWIDSIPVAGQVARAVAAVIGGIQLAETTIEVGISPPVYEFDLSLTHDVTFDIFPDKTNTQFPAVPPGYTLYYKVTYQFDNGSTPHVIPAVDVPDPTVKSIPVTIPSIPRGGKINVSVGFYARSGSTPDGQNDWCAAQGSTGLTPNDVETLPSIYIKQNKIPITAKTQYIHTRKTVLDAGGGHVWAETPTAPGYVAPPGGQQPGELGALRSITVRQGTAAQPGYVGYAWQAYSSGLVDCSAKAHGQLDQAANLSTDATNAQSGYAALPCGLQGGATSGVKLAYNLLGQDAVNIYLDTTSLNVRPVSLAHPPNFAPPSSGSSFGQLNFDSSRLLLHPTGHLVSINTEYHKLETLKLPGVPVSEAKARKHFVARTHSGRGTRPGLMASPAALAVSPDGVILVLEGADGNNRLQAFDLGGNPVRYFKKQKEQYFLRLDSTPGHTYLDLAVEFTGYLYVLSHDDKYVFRLDVYHPAQDGTQPISTTQNVTAARLAVDFWRSVYTLNYEVLRLPNGQVPGATEPSVSLWLPTLPGI